jgi:exosortase A-associated hydrolase 1
VKYEERPVLFDCAGERLVGVLAAPDKPAAVGLLVIVGGPQYRAGSHRQFVLLARTLAAEGYPTFRFDYRGMGDSTGEMRSFEAIDEDIARAIDAFVGAQPKVRSTVLWGLCDAASAAMMYAASDPRVVGLVLLNPWARGESTHAKAQLRHYYVKRLLSGSFWRKLIAGEVRVRESVGDLAGSVATAVKGSEVRGDYRERMLSGMKRFRGRVTLILSGQDLTTREFVDHVGSTSRWSEVLSTSRIQRVELPDADHTFTSPLAQATVVESTLAHVSRLVEKSC